jgi:hypothetical protein
MREKKHPNTMKKMPITMKNVLIQGRKVENIRLFLCIRYRKTHMMLNLSKYYRYTKNLNCSEVLGNETTAKSIV